MAKRGRMSNEDIAFIQSNCDELAVDQIAARLDRTVEQIAPIYRKAKRKPPKPPEPEMKVSEEASIRINLKNSEAWRVLEKEFSPDELRYFQERYIDLMAQFRDDVLATEVTQIFQLIKFEILMSRNLIAKMKMLQDIKHVEELQEALLSTPGGIKLMSEEQRDKLFELETSIKDLRAAEASRSTEYTKLQERSDGLMKTLKGTRDQRLDRIEKAGVNFIEVIKNFQNQDVQEKEGRQNELMKMAVVKEYNRLGRPHKYENGEIDLPILSVDTVDLPFEEESTEEN